MASMMDGIPEKYEGEKRVWECIKDNLPDDIVCYYNREVKGREFDFCLLIKDIGMLIIEVKGWNSSHIVRVKSPDEIELSDGSISRSPKKQARSYSFLLKSILKEKYGINPLIMNAVCYPFLSEQDINSVGLNIVSEPEVTFCREDISSSTPFIRKIIGIYKELHCVNHDKMSGNLYDVTRHYFEPSYIIKPPAQTVVPYSCLSVYMNNLSLEEIDGLLTDYFNGTKQIIFTNSLEDLQIIAKKISELFVQKNICINNGNLTIGSVDNNNQLVTVINNRLSIFNFEALYFDDADEVFAFKVYNGKVSDEQSTVLNKLSEKTRFNVNQYLIEHAPVDKDIQVKAGAGTGKTYSMVSRITYLCSQASCSDIYDPSSEIAMLTFTVDAALNMKSRLKQVFINYYILTGNIHYLDNVKNIEKMRISTIHSFAKEIISATSVSLGIGIDFTTVIGKYDKQKIFDRFFTDFLEEENKRSPVFFNRLPINIEDFRKLLLEIADKLYEKGCDIKTVGLEAWGDSPQKIPFFNEIVEKVIMKTEKAYSAFLTENNSVSLSEYMIHLFKCIADDCFNANLFKFKYVFIDEFQDTDDAQIAAFVAMQKKIGFHFFIVGDLKQSIYRFRGATMTAFEKMGCNNDKWISFTLNINYRSDKRLLEGYENIFRYMGMRQLLKYDPNTDLLVGVKESNISSDELLVSHKYNSQDKNGTSVYYDKLFEVIQQQQLRIRDEMSVRQLSDKERTIAILARKNRQVNEILREAKSRGLSIESDNNSDLYRLAPCKDLCRLTAALCNPYNPTYLYDLIHSRNINAEFDISSVLGKSDGEKAEIFIDCLDRFYQGILNKSWHEIISGIQNEPVLKSLRLIYEASQPWKAYSKDQYMQEYYRANYDLVFEELSKMNKKSYLTLNSIYESLYINIMTGTETKSREINIETDDVKILCLTVHKSKGLEYGTVILPVTDDSMDTAPAKGVEVTYFDEQIGYCMNAGKKHISNDNYPSKTEMIETMREESRILYVAMTRAINNFIWFENLDAEGNNWGRILKES